MCHMSPFCDNYGNNSMCQGVRPICEHYKGQVSFERNIPEWLSKQILAKIEYIKNTQCVCKNEVIKELQSILEMKYND